MQVFQKKFNSLLAFCSQSPSKNVLLRHLYATKWLKCEKEHQHLDRGGAHALCHVTEVRFAELASEVTSNERSACVHMCMFVSALC